jgi:hypothetical protein
VSITASTPAEVVLDELVPPWSTALSQVQARLFAFLSDHPRCSFRWTSELVYGNRIVRLATAGPVVMASFADTGTVVGWDSTSRSAIVALRGPTPSIDARDVLHRQLVQPALHDHGYVLLHGAGLATPAGAVVITGDSGSGKTALQLGLAAAVGGDLLGGGRVYIEGRGTVRPYPGRFAIGTGLLASRADLRSLPVDGPDERGKVTAASAKLAAALGCRLASAAPLCLVLAPRLDPGGSRLSWGPPLPRADARALIASQCLTPDARWPDWLGAFGSVDAETASARLNSATADTPVIPVSVPVTSETFDRAVASALLLGPWA